jgi:hypothetical protein
MQFLLTAGQQPNEIMTRVKEILTKQTAGKETIEK